MREEKFNISTTVHYAQLFTLETTKPDEHALNCL